MPLFHSIPIGHLQSYARIIQEGIALRRHFDLFKWLQGEIQAYLPHEIMLAAWGDFGSSFVRYDIVSSLPGVRTAHLAPAGLLPVLRGLHKYWVEMGSMPCASAIGHSNILHHGAASQQSFGPLRGMRSFMVHGISDKRGQHDCLYVFLSARDDLEIFTLGALEVLLPYLDLALRRVEPWSRRAAGERPLADSPENEEARLSERESEIMEWVKIGKTNAEIASILGISSSTVKNHMQHIFKKLEVDNRLRAVSKIERSPSYS
ncbi:MAG: XrtB/PEP-CTERM-associated transcriptional regulator EpsA [Nitrosospira sp.]